MENMGPDSGNGEMKSPYSTIHEQIVLKDGAKHKRRTLLPRVRGGDGAGHAEFGACSGKKAASRLKVLRDREKKKAPNPRGGKGLVS